MNTTATDTINETTALILSGQGYELTIATEAEGQKQELLALAATVAHVQDNDESARAQFASRKLAQMRIAVEKCRKEVKEPVNRIGKLIDAKAKEFVAEIEADEKRITKLVGDHAAEVARLKAEKEREERRLMEEARAKREAEEAAAAKAQSTGKISDIIAAKKAEEERRAALDERMAASTAVATTNVADGVRFAWDFEVVDIDRLYKAHPDLVKLEVRRAETIAQIKQAAEGGADMEESTWAVIGIRPFQKAVVSSR
jgi:hypothetical protein